mmetsp:Transcript_6360/g.6909  ORF Transcript_6360/g.6909 Transcript_6360/m.6909 type:complete len:289 (+) Transcript_6360:55-921(+)
MPFKNRTLEFSSLAEGLRERKEMGKRKDVKKRLPLHTTVSINRLASEIGRETHKTMQKLKDLTKLARSKSPFDDPSDEIQKYTFIIKQDIQSINNRIQEVEELCMHNSAQSNQAKNHETTLIDSLKSNLFFTTKDFTSVLQLRTDNLKSQQEQKQMITGSRITMSPSQHSYNKLYDEEELGDHDVTINLPLVQTQQDYMEERATVAEDIQNVLHEVQDIFVKLGDLVQIQGETIERIDDNINMSEMRIQEGHKHLLKFWENVQSDRWLYVKIFAILLVFAVLFVVFFV